MIDVENLTKCYGDTVAVNAITFSVAKGEIVGLLGPNGAGKTTTMRILTCYLPADGGRATIAGKDVSEKSLAVRRCLGYLPENNPLYHDMGVVEYLRFIASIRHIPRKQINTKIREMIETCGLKPVISKNIGELSKGFCQRVGLAQALIHDPDILILDEPTVGLDPNQIVEIRELIKKIGKEKTVILSSHILPEVAATCQRIIIMNKGSIAASGTPAEMAGRTKGGNVINLVIRGPEAEVQVKLRMVRNVKEFEIAGEENGKTRFKIISSGDDDVAEELFRMAVDNNWTLSELHQESLSLEDIFQQLTIEER
ncbi:MAG: ATP-binding cassette domain-containing protein [Deltaproteobacteria bacterium]|nr:ATP-binding cassette domain-containing protein [Deltaproteobacteria bacterium]